MHSEQVVWVENDLLLRCWQIVVDLQTVVLSHPLSLVLCYTVGASAHDEQVRVGCSGGGVWHRCDGHDCDRGG